MKNDKRIFRIEVRLLESEYNLIKQHASKHKSTSQYIREAIKEYGNTDIASRITAIRQLTEHYREYHNVLYHAAANLNQTMKRANELHKAGLMTTSYLQSNVMPSVQSASNVIMEIRDTLNAIMRSIQK